MDTKFPWGRVIEVLTFDLGGKLPLVVTAHHPWKRHSNGFTVLTGQPDLTRIEYHCEEMREGFHNLETLMVAWLVQVHNGYGNNTGVVRAICRAIGINIDSNDGQ